MHFPHTHNCSTLMVCQPNVQKTHSCCVSHKTLNLFFYCKDQETVATVSLLPAALLHCCYVTTRAQLNQWNCRTAPWPIVKTQWRPRLQLKYVWGLWDRIVSTHTDFFSLINTCTVHGGSGGGNSFANNWPNFFLSSPIFQLGFKNTDLIPDKLLWDKYHAKFNN